MNILVTSARKNRSATHPATSGKAGFVKYRHNNRYVDWWLVSCPKCHITQAGSEYEFSFEAIEAWNRRVDNGR